MTGTRDKILYKRDGAWQQLAPAQPREMLLDHIRLREKRTGTKEGCNEGDCGACTVVLKRMVEGRAVYQPVNSCILLTGQMDGAELITIEDLSRNGTMHPVQAAMVKHHGSQCGFCTPGIVMSLYALYENTDAPVRREEVLEALQGNLCRCTGYRPIINAALEACNTRFDRPGMGGTAAASTPSILSLSKDAPASDFKTDLFMGDDKRFFAAPSTEQGFANLLHAHPDALIVSGATDVGLWITKRLDDPQKLVWTGKIAGFDRIEQQEDTMFLGAGATHLQVRDVLSRIDPDLDEVMRRFGSAQVRGSGTIGGNIANGSPIGDLAPCLIALDATLHLRQGDAQRTLPLEAFFLAYGKQDRRPAEFVTGVSLPMLSKGKYFRAAKLSKRVDEDISSVLLALNATLEQGHIRSIRIAFGGMAGTPKRALTTESALTGQKLANTSEWQSAIDALEKDFQPLSDMRASAAYRMQAAKGMLKRLLTELADPSRPTRLSGQRHQEAAE